MRETATAVANFIADLRQGSGLDGRGLAPFGGEIEERTKTAQPPEEFQVAYHPQVQTGRGRVRKVRKYSEYPHRAAD